MTLFGTDIKGVGVKVAGNFLRKGTVIILIPIGCITTLDVFFDCRVQGFVVLRNGELRRPLKGIQVFRDSNDVA